MLWWRSSSLPHCCYSPLDGQVADCPYGVCSARRGPKGGETGGATMRRTATGIIAAASAGVVGAVLATAVYTNQATTLPVADEGVVVAGAGDITQPPNHSATTAALLANIAGLTNVVTFGDNTPDGTLAQYTGAYGNTWGKFKTITHPTPGNHDWKNAGAKGFKTYFGLARTYYSWNVGGWHMVALDSNCKTVGGCSASSPEGKWLAADLAANHPACIAAYDHRPRYSPGEHGSWSGAQPFWTILAKYGADVFMSGHDGLYARFAPVSGIRQFVVGTGGGSLDKSLTSRPAGLQSSVLGKDGVLALTLGASSYDWRYLTASGVADSGTSTC